MNSRNCKRLCEFEEIKSQGKAVEVRKAVEQEEKLQTFVRISSTDSASERAVVQCVTSTAKASEQFA